MDNDGAHKFAFHLVEMLRDLLRLVAPWTDELDFDNAREISAAHVEASGDGFKQRYGDALWRVPFRRGRLGDGSRPYLLVLVEFQSTVDRGMARRMRNYADMLRGRLLRTTAAREGGLPWILPVVVYNGSERWTAPGERSDMAALPSARAERTLAWFQHRGYELVSLERMLAEPGPALARWPSDNRLLATFRLQTTRAPEELLRCLEREYAHFPGPDNVGTRRVLHAWAAALLADMVGGGAGGVRGAAPLPAFAELEGLEGTKMTTIAQERLGKWFENFRAENVAQGIEQGMAQGIEQGVAQGIEQGVAQGIERGMAQGIEQGRAMAHAEGVARLRRQVAIKFGDAEAERLADLLGAAATGAELDRVGAWLMECADGDELLGRVESLRKT